MSTKMANILTYIFVFSFWMMWVFTILIFVSDWFIIPALVCILAYPVTGIILYPKQQTVVITHTQVMSLSNLGLAKEKKPKTGLTVADIHADYLEERGCPKEFTDMLRKFDQC